MSAVDDVWDSENTAGAALVGCVPPIWGVVGGWSYHIWTVASITTSSGLDWKAMISSVEWMALTAGMIWLKPVWLPWSGAVKLGPSAKT